MKGYVGLAAASLLSLGLMGGARAADMAMAVKAPVSVSGCAWCGFYVGDNVGYGFGRNSENSVLTAPVPPFVGADVAAVSAAGSPRTQSNGITAGAQAGYNWQAGAAVYGVEADINAFALRGNTSGNFVFPSTLPGGAVGPPPVTFPVATSVSTDWLMTARGRLGWANNDWMVYGTGGLAVGNVKVNQVVGLVAPNTVSSTVSSTRAGWTVGAGFEYMMTRNWSVKGEYLYVDLGTASTTGVVAPVVAGLTYTTSAHVTANIARVGVNYHFGGPVVARY